MIHLYCKLVDFMNIITIVITNIEVNKLINIQLIYLFQKRYTVFLVAVLMCLSPCGCRGINGWM